MGNSFRLAQAESILTIMSSAYAGEPTKTHGNARIMICEHPVNMSRLMRCLNKRYIVELPPTSRLKKLVDYEKISRLLVD
jgi:hypothetical protein